MIKKQIFFINPSPDHWFLNLAFSCLVPRSMYFPMSFLILSALTPKEYQIKIYNRAFVMPPLRKAQGALVGITCLTHNAYKAYRLADQYRQAGAFVVMGGPHVSALPDEALEHCHSVVLKEAESVWPQVVKDFEANDLKKIYQGEPLEDFFSPVYEYFLTLKPSFLRQAGILVSRGCKYCCAFCARPSSWVRHIKQDQVVSLIERGKDQKRHREIHGSWNKAGKS